MNNENYDFEVFESSNAPKPIGCYSQMLSTNNASKTYYLSGQIPLNSKNGQIVVGSIKEQARQVFDNIDNVLKEAGLTRGNVIKTTCFVTNIEDFGLVNEVYDEFFSEVDSKPARSLVEVSRLPKDVLIEIETIAAK